MSSQTFVKHLKLHTFDRKKTRKATPTQQQLVNSGNNIPFAKISST